MRYTNFEIDKMLKSMVILVDTREQDTPALRKRLKGLNCPFERQKLNVGDYSVYTKNEQGEVVSLADKCVVERKMSLDELCACFTKGRSRFQREFERAKENGCQIHLLVENASYEKMLAGDYRSKLPPKSLRASKIAWEHRYDYHYHECHPSSTPSLIYDILYYALKEHLENLQEVENGSINFAAQKT